LLLVVFCMRRTQADVPRISGDLRP